MTTESWPVGDAILRGVSCQWSAAVVAPDGALLWGHKPDEQRKAASTIKLGILIALFRAIDAGELRLADRRELHAADKVPGSGVLKAMDDGLALTLHDLAHLMISISDNSASNMLIEAVGLAEVNAALRDLGAERTVLGRKFYGRAALPGEPENLTTARDLARLLVAILGNHAASAASCEAMLGYLRGQNHLDRLARRLPESVPYAGKTGSLTGTVLDAGIVFAPARPLIIAAIAADLTDAIAAEEAMGQLALAAAREWGGLR
jgi:beta-lactamase class A